jgi:hypothetical protein
MRYFPKLGRLIEFVENKTLTEIANEFETDKGDAKNPSWSKAWPEHTTMHYTKTYEKYMDAFRTSAVKLFEIGICDQRFPFASQKMWLSYFKNVDCYGMDNFWGKYLNEKLDDVRTLNMNGVNFIYADQGNFCDWNELKRAVPDDFDFFIEDGSHWPNHMVVSLWQARNMVKSGGYYFMEDLQNSVTARGKFRYDNSLLTDELLMTLHTKKFNSLFLNDQQNQDVRDNFELVEMVLEPAGVNYLAVFRKL